MSEIAFYTERLVVRRWRDSDLLALVAVYGDADAMHWVGDSKPITQEQCVRWLQVTQANYDERAYGMFAVEEIAAPGAESFTPVSAFLRSGCLCFSQLSEREVRCRATNRVESHAGYQIACCVMRNMLQCNHDQVVPAQGTPPPL